MFINCPHCSALVATDPATDLPPARCPRCAAKLREVEPHPAEPATLPPPSEAAAESVPSPAAPLAEAIAATTAPLANDATDAAVATQAGTRATPDAPADVIAAHGAAPASATGVPEARTETVARDERAGPVADTVRADDSIAATPVADLPTEAAPGRIENASPTGASQPVPPPQAPESRAADRTPPPGEIAPPAAEGDDTTLPQRGDNATADATPAPDDDAETGAGATDSPAPPAPAAAPASARRNKPAPSFARTRAPVAATSARRRWTLPSLIAGLSLLLALQWILADRARLASDAGWRPFVAQLCATLRCGLPPWREPSAFALLERDVRPHPDVPGALRVTATFRNDARWPQPWPQVVLTLSDVDGRTVGARAFDAAEYLGAAPTQNELASGQTATIRMDVLEPAPRVVAFAFDFR